MVEPDFQYLLIVIPINYITSIQLEKGAKNVAIFFNAIISKYDIFAIYKIWFYISKLKAILPFFKNSLIFRVATFGFVFVNHQLIGIN